MLHLGTYEDDHDGKPRPSGVETNTLPSLQEQREAHDAARAPPFGFSVCIAGADLTILNADDVLDTALLRHLAAPASDASVEL